MSDKTQATARPVTLESLGITESDFRNWIMDEYIRNKPVGTGSDATRIAAGVWRAVNSHDKLLAAARAAEEMLAEISHYVPDEEFDEPDGQNVNTMREQLRAAIAEAEGGCQTCIDIATKHGGFGPSHNGSRLCESGSIASGGKNSHCTCDTCF